MAKRKQAVGAVAGPSYRIQVRLPADWREAVEAAAAKSGVPVSAFVRDAVADRLPKRVRSKLSPVRVGKPKRDA